MNEDGWEPIRSVRSVDPIFHEETISTFAYDWPIFIEVGSNLKLKQVGTAHTVWKFRDFSLTQILREINIEECRSFKTAVFAIFVALNFVTLVNFSLQKVLKFMKITARQFIEDDRF